VNSPPQISSTAVDGATDCATADLREPMSGAKRARPLADDVPSTAGTVAPRLDASSSIAGATLTR